MKNKIKEFLKTETYETIKDNFMDALENSYIVDLKMMISPSQVADNVSNLCDAFLFNCMTKMLDEEEKVVSEISFDEIGYYKKWVSLIKEALQPTDRSLKEELGRLEQIVYNAGNCVYEASSEGATENKKKSAIKQIVIVFTATVSFYLRMGLDPIEILRHSIFDCEMEEYGAMEHLMGEVVYKIDTTCKAADFLPSIKEADPTTHDEFIEALYEIWGTFNIFRAKSDMCSPDVFEENLLALLKKMRDKK